MKTILAAIDFRGAGEQILHLSLRMARAFEARVYLLHVEAPPRDAVGLEPGRPQVRERREPDALTHHQQLEVFREWLKEEGIEAHALLIEGPTVRKVLDEAERLGVELIILGSRRHGPLYELFRGSICEGIVRNACCPVLLVPEQFKGAARD